MRKTLPIVLDPEPPCAHGSILACNKWRRMRDLNPRDFRLRVFETRALGRYANPPSALYFVQEENFKVRRMRDLNLRNLFNFNERKFCY